MKTASRSARFLWLVIVSATLATALPPDGITVLVNPPPEYRFNESLSFQIVAHGSVPITDVKLILYQPLPDATARPLTYSAQFTPGADITATITLDLSGGLLIPFTQATYWWELTDNSGVHLNTPPQTFDYVDNRFAWQRRDRSGISIFWYAGNTDFGDQAAAIADTAMARLNPAIYGPLPPSLRLYIYANEQEARPLLSFLGEFWAGNYADADRDIVILVVPPNADAIYNLRRLIPHELTHLAVAAAAGHNVPEWLNEGLAELNQFQSDPDLLSALVAARAAGRLLPLSRLCGTFPSDPDQARLAYAQSESLVRFIRERYGSAGVAALLRAYAGGADCAAGVESGLGITLASLEQQWLTTSLRLPPSETSASVNFWRKMVIGAGILGLMVGSYLLWRRRHRRQSAA